MVDKQGKIPLEELAGKVEGIVSVDDKGVVSEKPIKDITDKVLSDAIPNGLMANELVAVNNGAIVGTGIIGKDGDGQFAAGTVSVGFHDISSGGENVIVKNRASGVAYSPIWETVSEDSTHEATIRSRDIVHRNISYQSDISNVIKNPEYTIKFDKNITIFRAKYNAAAPQTNVIVTIEEPGAKDNIWRSKPRDLNVGEQEFVLHVPLDLKSNTDYVVKARSVDGDVKMLGNLQGVPAYSLTYRYFTDLPLLPTDDSMSDTMHSWSASNIAAKIKPATDGIAALQVGQQVIQSNIAQKISGIHIEDVDNNAFDDITALHFDGAEVSDDGGKQATVTIKPRLNVSNGQTPSSNNYDVTALEFPGSTLSTRNNGSIGVVNIEKSNNIDVYQNGSSLGQFSKIETSNDLKATIDPLDPTKVKLDVDIKNNDQISKNTTAIDTLKAIVSQEEQIYSYIGSTVPNLPASYRGEYYLHFENQATALSITLPDFSHNENGTKFAVVNADSANAITVVAPSGYSIDNEDSYIVQPNSSAYLIKKSSTRWVVGLTETNGNGTGSGSGLTIDNGSLNVANVNTLKLPTSEFVDQGSGSVVVMPQITMTNQGDDAHDTKANTITLQSPLKTFEDPDVTGGAKVYIDPSAYEKQHSPTYLAYLENTQEIIGKHNQGEKGHHDGTLWFDDIVVPADSPFLSTDRTNKGFRIEEADELDPNVSGGTDYLIVFRIHMKGKAPEDGFVRAYLYNKNTNPFEPKGYLLDVNGQPLGVERHYKKDEELGVLEVVGIVNAKGQKEFTCHVVDNFVNDMILLTDRTEGCTGLVIQALTSKEKTGLGLLQFENDTLQNIEFSSHYLGADRTSIDWIIAKDQPVKTGAAGAGQTMADGMHFYNISQMKIGVESGHLLFEDDGSNICDFNFGKIFSAEETQMLRGKDVKFTTTITDKDSGYNIALMKWIGKPDEYTPEIFTSRNTTPNFQTNWAKVDDLFISEDIVVGDHMATKTFTVPSDANNYAIIIYPAIAQQPLTLKLKQFQVDVVTPFIGYAVKTSEKINESHLEFDTEHKQLIQNTQGYSSLRYTINNSPTAMPIGMLTKGLADVSIDKSINVIAGSGAKGGEGAIVFNSEGNATIHTGLYLWNEQGTDTTVNFWYSTVGANSKLTKIPNSDGTFTVAANSKGTQYYMPAFNLQVEGGDKIALTAQADKADGAFLQCVTDARPMINTTIKFKELISTSGDDPFADIDLSKFDRVHSSSLTAVKVIKNASSASINLDLPEDVDISILQAVKKLSDNTIRPVKSLDYSYKNGLLNVSFGENVDQALITIGVYI